MDTMSSQEILTTYLCVIGTVALALWWYRIPSGRDHCGPPRAGQSEPAPPRGAMSVQGAFGRTARDLRAPEARAAKGMREPAFNRSAPALTRIGNSEPGRAPSHARRGAYVREASLVQSAPNLLETSGLASGGMGGEQRAGRTPSSARMRANAREAPATPGSPALPPSCSQWRFENERA
jgi:hypothetical protein